MGIKLELLDQKKTSFNWTNMPKEKYKNFLKGNITDYIGKTKKGDIEAEFIYDKNKEYLDINLYYGTLKEKRDYGYSKEKDGLDYGFEQAEGFSAKELPNKYTKFKKKAEEKILSAIAETNLIEYAYFPTGFWEEKKNLLEREKQMNKEQAYVIIENDGGKETISLYKNKIKAMQKFSEKIFTKWLENPNEEKDGRNRTIEECMMNKSYTDGDVYKVYIEEMTEEKELEI